MGDPRTFLELVHDLLDAAAEPGFNRDDAVALAEITRRLRHVDEVPHMSASELRAHIEGHTGMTLANLIDAYALAARAHILTQNAPDTAYLGVTETPEGRRAIELHAEITRRLAILETMRRPTFLKTIREIGDTPVIEALDIALNGPLPPLPAKWSAPLSTPRDEPTTDQR